MRHGAWIALAILAGCGDPEAQDPGKTQVCEDCETHTPDGDADTDSDTDSDTDEDTDTDDTDVPPEESPVRVVLHGGGAEEDVLFGMFAEAAGFGHIVTLGANDPADEYLLFYDTYWVQLGAASAATVNTTGPADAANAAFIAEIDAADGIWFRGGDQTEYLAHWEGTAIQEALVRAWDRGVVLGGSSAGCAILGERIYDAKVGSIDPYQALLDPYDKEITFTDGFLPALPGVLTDTHFTERGRLGRLPVFLTRWVEDGAVDPLGIGVDPGTALFVREDGTAEVVGTGSVTLVRPPATFTMTKGDPPDLRDLRLWQLPAGYVVDLHAADPVLARPAWSAPPASLAVPVWTERWLEGSVRADRELGEWIVPGIDDEPYAWYYGELDVVPSPDPELMGTFVMTALYDDLDYAENHVGATMFALAQHPGAVGVLLDVGMDVHLDPMGTAQTDSRSYAIFLDTSTMKASGVPAIPGNPDTAALEDVRMDVVGEGLVWP